MIGKSRRDGLSHPPLACISIRLRSTALAIGDRLSACWLLAPALLGHRKSTCNPRYFEFASPSPGGYLCPRGWGVEAYTPLTTKKQN